MLGELELGWRLVPNETIAVTGSNGKTTTVELIGHLHRTAGLPVVVVGNVGHGADLARRLRPAGGGDRRLRGVVVPARGHAALRARRRRAAQPRRGPPRPPRHVRRLQAPPSSRCSPASRPAPSPSRRTELAGGRAAGRGRARAGSASAAPGRRALVDRDGALWWDGERLIAVDEIRLRGAAQPPERDGRRRGRARPRAWRPTAVREGLASVRRRRAPARGGRDAATACSTSTTPRPRTSPPRSPGSSRSRAACT